MRFSAESRLAVGTLADLSGELERLDDGFAATLDTLDLRQQGVAATLTAPATVTLRGGAVELTPLGLDVGTRQPHRAGPGRRRPRRRRRRSATCRSTSPTPSGPTSALAGTVNGTARVTGPRDAPDVRFDLAAAGVGSAMTRERRAAAGDARRHAAAPRTAGLELDAPASAGQRPRRRGARARCRSAPATSTSRSTCRPSRWRWSTGWRATAACAAR